MSTPGASTLPEPMFTLVYSKKDISADIAPYVLSVSWTDHLEGESDEIEIELEDRDGLWMDAWYPGKGDTLKLAIGYKGQSLTPCGSFEIDEIELEQPPSTVRIKALSTGVSVPVRTRGGYTYENTTLAAIVAQVAKRNQLTVVGEIDALALDHVSQWQDTDLAFLRRLAREYGYAFKLVGTQLVFTRLAALRSASVVATLTPQDLMAWRITDKIRDVYQDAEVSYHDPKSKKLIVATASNQDTARVGLATSADKRRIHRRATSTAQAKVMVQAELDRHNLARTIGSLKLTGNPVLVAGLTIQLNGFGQVSGTYLIESSHHSISRSSGYITEPSIKRAT
jgi:phage protein D